jgi:hypothetical protein
MIIQILRIFLTYFLSLSLIFTPLLQAEQLALPSADLIAPQVIHETIKEPSTPGINQKITAVVTDNVAVQSVTLFYRSVGNKEYQRKSMSTKGSDIYSAVIDADEMRAPGIEYYIQATDAAGNNLLHGYAFSPLLVTVSGTAAATVAATAPVKNEANMAPKKEESSNKWLWIGLGVLAVGAAAGGGGGSDSSTPPTATLTITTTEP